MAPSLTLRQSSRWQYTVLASVLIFLCIAFLSYHTTPTASFRLGSGSGVNSFDDNLIGSSRLSQPTNGTKRNAIIGSVQRKDETTADWILDFLPDWEPVIYVTDRSPSEAPEHASSRIQPLALPVNQGREAAVYLDYIVDNYYNLPDYMVFIHGQRYQIHNDDPMFDSVPTISRLNLDYVTEIGYASLKCNLAYCPRPWLEPNVDHEDGFWEIQGMYALAWKEFFPDQDLPQSVVGPCCAQFAITREAIHQRPLELYERMRQWAWRYDHHPLTSMNTGLVFEYMWHIIWEKPAHFCPDARECYCKKWGLCDLECERDEWCLGRNWFNPEKPRYLGLPPGVPKNWPQEGQGDDSSLLPYDGWWNKSEILKDH